MDRFTYNTFFEEASVDSYIQNNRISIYDSNLEYDKFDIRFFHPFHGSVPKYNFEWGNLTCHKLDMHSYILEDAAGMVSDVYDEIMRFDENVGLGIATHVLHENGHYVGFQTDILDRFGLVVCHLPKNRICSVLIDRDHYGSMVIEDKANSPFNDGCSFHMAIYTMDNELLCNVGTSVYNSFVVVLPSGVIMTEDAKFYTSDGKLLYSYLSYMPEGIKDRMVILSTESRLASDHSIVVDLYGKEICRNPELMFDGRIVTGYKKNYGICNGIYDYHGNNLLPCKYSGFEELFKVDGNTAVSFNYAIDEYYDKRDDMYVDIMVKAYFNLNGTPIAFLNGRPVYINSDKYILISNFVNDFAMVYGRNGKWGIIDSEQKEVFPCMFDSAVYQSESKFVVRIGNKYGVVNTLGETIIPIKFDSLGKKNPRMSGCNN